MSTSARSVSILVPTRNEAENIATLVSHIVASAVPFHEIVFVDDDVRADGLSRFHEMVDDRLQEAALTVFGCFGI